MSEASSASEGFTTLVGSEEDDAFLITAPVAVDGLGGFDTIVFDFSTCQIGIRLDLRDLWTGGIGYLNGFEIRNIEAMGRLFPESENRFVLGSEQDDEILLGEHYLQRTVIYGLGGNDALVGGNWDDDTPWLQNFLNGGSGDDVVIGGSGGDDLIGEDGNDRLYGGAGTDFLYGDEGLDLLRGGDGEDYLRGGAGNDQLFGDDGDDRLDGSGGFDLLFGGAGSDTAEYYGADGGVTVDLAAGTARESVGNYLDLLVSIENAAGSFFDDVLRGSDGANRLDGDAGDDRLFGGRGDDVLAGGAGSDRLEGGAGADVFLFRDGETGVDLIRDFNAAAGDRIDLSGVDADRTSWWADDAFSYIGGSAFTGTAGELRVVAGHGRWEVSGDCDGDGVADFSVLVVSAAAPLAQDFVL